MYLYFRPTIFFFFCLCTIYFCFKFVYENNASRHQSEIKVSRFCVCYHNIMNSSFASRISLPNVCRDLTLTNNRLTP